MISDPWWSSDHEFESHHFYLFDKNQAQDNMGLCGFQVKKKLINSDYIIQYISFFLGRYILRF
jgi:hypothetical protein